MPLSTDITVDTVNRRIDCPTSLASSTFYVTQDLFSYLEDLFDEQGSVSLPGAMALDIAMSAQTPTDATVGAIVTGTRPWYLTQRLAKHLKGGSIQTTGYTGNIYLLQFGSTYTNCVSSDEGKTVTASGGNTGTLLEYDNAQKKWWVYSPTSTWGNSLAVSITGGTGAGTTASSGGAGTGEEGFSNALTVGNIQHGNQFFSQGTNVYDGTGWYGVGNSTGNGTTATNLHFDILIKIREKGSFISSGSVTVFNRNNKDASGATTGDTYDYRTVDLTTFGRNVIPLSTQVDSSDNLTDTVASTYLASALGGSASAGSINVTYGSYSFDVDSDGTAESYVCQIDCNNQLFSIVYPVTKYITRKGSLVSLNGSAGQTYLSANPSTYTIVNSNPFGTYQAGTFLFAQGVYPINVNAADASAYKTIDAAGVTHSPPTYASGVVTQLNVGDRVAAFVGTPSGSTYITNRAQYTLASGNNSGNGTVVVTASIPADTPSAGWIRVYDNSDNTEQRYAYTAFNSATKTFTLSGTLSRTYTSATAYVPLIDTTVTSGSSVSQAVQFVTPRNYVVVVRKGSGTNKRVPYNQVVPFTSTGFSIPASAQPNTNNTTP